MKGSVKAYLAEIGRRGGRKSRRVLDPDMARAIVRIREARRFYLRSHTKCLCSFDPEYPIGLSNVTCVAEQLRKHGGHEAWKAAEKLCGI